MLIAKNLSVNPDRNAQAGIAFQFRDWNNKVTQKLLTTSSLFKNASKNGAHAEEDIEHVPL